MINDTKWMLGCGLQFLGSEFRDGRWTVSVLGQGSGQCPICDIRSTRRYSWRVRSLQDLPAQGIRVVLRLRLARWRCCNDACERQTFGDRLPRVALSSAHRTSRVADLTRLLGHVASGRPAERLMSSLGPPRSDDTILRHLKRYVGARDTAVRVVGIDDVALLDRVLPHFSPERNRCEPATVIRLDVSTA